MSVRITKGDDQGGRSHYSIWFLTPLIAVLVLAAAWLVTLLVRWVRG